MQHLIVEFDEFVYVHEMSEAAASSISTIHAVRVLFLTYYFKTTIVN